MGDYDVNFDFAPLKPCGQHPFESDKDALKGLEAQLKLWTGGYAKMEEENFEQEKLLRRLFLDSFMILSETLRIYYL